MIQAKISPFQLFCLMFLFELGSAIVVGLGLGAKQDAWLTILLGMICSIPLFLLYTYLYQQYPDIPLTSYLPRILGKFIGFPVAIVYTVYFFYIAARVLRDFGDLMIISIYDLTPLYAINGFMILIIAYGIYCGIEVIGRASEQIFFIMVLLIFFGIGITLLSGLIDVRNLSPFLEGGWKPVISTVLLQTYTFPFGEIVVFTMLLPHLNTPQLVKKIGIFALIGSGSILSLTIAIEISILGVAGTSSAQFPLLETVTKVSIGGFIQRLDVIVVTTLILCMFVKILVFFYAGFTGIIGILNLSKKKHKRYCLLIISIVLLFYSQTMAGSFTEHIKVGLEWVPLYLHLPLQTGIPVLLFLIALIKKTIQNKMNTEEKHLDSN